MSKQRPKGKALAVVRAGGFADQVDKLHFRLLAGKPGSKSERHSRHVRQVAVGLTVIRRALDIQLKKLAPHEWPETGIVWAFSLLDALMTGRGDPFWRYINDVRSTRRGGKAPVSKLNELSQICIVGFVRAYEQAAVKSRRKATKMVLDVCRSDDFSFTVDAVLEWNKKFLESGNVGPDAFANELLGRAKKHPGLLPVDEVVLALGRQWVQQLWAVPN
jgi:hypothetical protein